MTNLLKTAAILSLCTIQPAAAQDAFTGFYGGLGVELGYHQEILDPLTATNNGVSQIDPQDVAGLTLLGGYTGSFGSWILGGEAEFSFASVDFSETDCMGPAAAPCADAFVNGQLDNIIRLRALAGQAVTPDTMLFATLGLTAATVQIDSLQAIAIANGMAASSVVFYGVGPEMAYGFNVGVGVEHRVTERFSIRGDVAYERVYLDVPPNGGVGANAMDIGNALSAAIGTNGEASFDNLRFGVTAVFRF